MNTKSKRLPCKKGNLFCSLRPMSHFVYILYSDSRKCFYVGTTDDIEKRLAEHNIKKYGNKSFTAKGRPWKLFHQIHGLESQQAYDIECHIKKMKSKKYIENLKKFPELEEKLKTRFRPR